MLVIKADKRSQHINFDTISRQYPTQEDDEDRVPQMPCVLSYASLSHPLSSLSTRSIISLIF